MTFGSWLEALFLQCMYLLSLQVPSKDLVSPLVVIPLQLQLPSNSSHTTTWEYSLVGIISASQTKGVKEKYEMYEECLLTLPSEHWIHNKHALYEQQEVIICDIIAIY
jgi:hypothetical protein